MQLQSLDPPAFAATPAVPVLWLTDGTERCALTPGIHSVGGRGADALPLASVGSQPRAATIAIGGDRRAVLQRTTASVVVRLDGEPIGIAAVGLRDGSRIEFGDCRLTLEMNGETSAADDFGARRAARRAEIEATTSETPTLGHAAARDAVTQPPAPGADAFLVNVRTGRRFPLSTQRVLIGRDNACDIVVNGNGVSRRHASISPVSGGFMLRDESANGTIVNGTRVAGTYLLGHGDVVRFHLEELRVELDAHTSPVAAASSDATAILDLSHITGGMSREARPSVSRTLTASLEIVRGSFTGACFQIDRAVCSIGRGEENDVRIRDDTVSTTHATLLRKGATWFVVDLRSMNGSFVDGSRVSGERELPPGSRLRVGAVEMVFRAFDTAVEAPVAPRREGLLSRVGQFLRGIAPPSGAE